MGFKRDILNGNECVKFLFKEMDRRNIRIKQMAYKTGYTGSTLSNWRYRSMPRIDSIEACLNTMGYTLKVVRKE